MVRTARVPVQGTGGLGKDDLFEQAVIWIKASFFFFLSFGVRFMYMPGGVLR